MNSLTGPEKIYLTPVCRGCWQLGNNCGTCERCRDTRPGFGSDNKYRHETSLPQLTDKIIVRAHEMIKAHFESCGVAPQVLSIPSPTFFVEGVKVTFHNMPQHFSSDGSQTLHHHFKEHN